MRKSFIKYPQFQIFAAAIGTPQFNEMTNKYYPNVKSNDIQHLIELDPTYKEGSKQLGTYGRWILNLANKGPIQNVGHLRDVLTRFEEEKKHLINKDIMKYKSVDDVENMLNDDSSYKDKTHRQEVRERQKNRRNVDLEKDAEKVYEDSEWVVYVPKTYAASCKLGEGTKWCTASTEDDYYYENYKQKYGGEYYIIINKQHPNHIKFQFHFESEQFMNKNDEAIDLNGFLNENIELRNFFMNLYPDAVIDISDPDNIVYEYTGDYIPESVRNYIKHVVVSGVDSIDRSAFEGCRNLETVEILDTVIEIEHNAFYDCVSLQHVVFSNTLTHIDDGAFAYCHRLTNVRFPPSLQYIGSHAFLECESLDELHIPRNVRLVSWDAFSRCRELEYVHIVEGVRAIDANVFEGCTQLKRIDIPMSVRSMNLGIFKNCPNVIIYSDNPIALEYADKYDIPVITSEENMTTL